jgi:hypothetical protein
MHKIVAGQQVRWYPSGQPRVKWLWAASGACKYPLHRMCSIELKETSEVIYSTCGREHAATRSVQHEAQSMIEQCMIAMRRIQHHTD